MTKTAWVIMKQSHYPAFINVPSVHMVGFGNKGEAAKVCNLLNERAANLSYYLQKAKVYQSWEP